ncbi:MAG: hydroxymethylbilane synthase [Hyphomicrobium sp.]
MQVPSIRIGTRGSPLAMAQAHEVRDRIAKAHGLAQEAISITVIKTMGDQVLDRPLSEIGGKGLFTKEIEDALLANEIDVAVHSMKDMQTALPDGLSIGAVLPREDVRDAFISLKYASIADLPKGTTVGTSSLRRQAQLLNARPDLDVIGFRGNVQTRLKKLQEGVADATFLAVAGLKRLGLADRITSAIPLEQMLPAVAQGAIGLEIRSGDEKSADMIAPLNDAATALAVTAERAFLARLEGSCRTPIAGHAHLSGGKLHFSGQVLSPDGKASYHVSRSGAPEHALDIGIDAANEVLAMADPSALVKPHATAPGT